MLSEQNTEEQMRQKQLVGMGASSQQQPFHPTPAGGNYAPFIPQVPLQIANAQSNGRVREPAVSMGKLSLLTISFSLMLLGAFTFLGGFLLGIWVSEPRASQPMGYLPPQQNLPYYPTGAAYPQGTATQQGSNFDVGKQVGSAAEAAIKSDIHGIPTALSPLVKAAQSELARQVGEKAENFVKQNVGRPQTYPQQQFSPPVSPVENHPHQPYGGPTQLPVVTPQSSTTSGPTAVSHRPTSQENGEGYTIQLGTYASHENATALVNHMQALSYSSQATECKDPDGRNMYCVYSGFYKDYTTALNAASQFPSQDIPGAIIVKVSQEHKSAS